MKMIYRFLVFYYLLGTLQVVTGTFDTSNYIRLFNKNRGSFDYWFQKCKQGK